MEKQPSSGIYPHHRTAAWGFEIKTGGKAIAVGLTEQKLSAHAGSATFWGWLRPSECFPTGMDRFLILPSFNSSAQNI
jgi:hypothetical protein